MLHSFTVCLKWGECSKKWKAKGKSLGQKKRGQFLKGTIKVQVNLKSVSQNSVSIAGINVQSSKINVYV